MMLGDSGYIRNYLAFGALFLLFAAILTAAIYIFSTPSSVRDLYFLYGDAMYRGAVPYADNGMAWEYPPMAFVLFLIPRLMASSPFGYGIAYNIEVFAFFMIGLWLIKKTAEHYGRNPVSFMGIYALLMILMFEFVADRYDIFPMVTTAAAIYCYVTGRRDWALVFLTVAAAMKLYPAMIVPLVLISMLAGRDWKSLAKGISVSAAAVALLVIPLFLAGADPLSYLQYHILRPLQVETVAASVIMMATSMGLTSSWTMMSFGSDNLFGPWADIILPYLPVLTGLSAVFLYAAFATVTMKMKRIGEGTDPQFAIIAFLLISMSMVFGKVLSPQFLIWLIPFAILVLACVPGRFSTKRHFLISMAAQAILIQAAFLVNYGMRAADDPFTDAGMALIVIKNLALFASVYLAGSMLGTRIRRKGNGTDPCEPETAA